MRLGGEGHWSGFNNPRCSGPSPARAWRRMQPKWDVLGRDGWRLIGPKAKVLRGSNAYRGAQTQSKSSTAAWWRFCALAEPN